MEERLLGLLGQERRLLALGGLLSLLLVWVVGFEGSRVGGLLALQGLDAGAVHEFFHDFRHVAGLPCH